MPTKKTAPANQASKGAGKAKPKRELTPEEKQKAEERAKRVAAAKRRAARQSPEKLEVAVKGEDARRTARARYASYLNKRGRLINAIQVIAERRGLEMENLGKKIGIEEFKWRGLLRGVRRADALSGDDYDRIAKWMGSSPIEVMLLAGFLSEQQLRTYGDIDQTLLTNAYESMRADPYMVGLLPDPKVWALASLQMKVMSIVLYQRLVGAHFLSVLKVPGT